jgi:hypothetical protein
MELLGRVADLSAHPELVAVGEAGGGVDVDRGRIDRTGEPLGGLLGGGDDRLGVPGPVRVDVLDRLTQRVDHRDRHLHPEVLGVPVVGPRLVDRHRAGVLAGPLIAY